MGCKNQVVIAGAAMGCLGVVNEQSAGSPVEVKGDLFHCIQFLTETTVTGLDELDADGVFAETVFPAGSYLHGQITGITFTGSIRAYKGQR